MNIWKDLGEPNFQRWHFAPSLHDYDNDVLIKIQSKRIPLKFGKLNDMEW